MREILFRGKRIDNGEWIEGSLITYCLTKDQTEKQYAIKLQDAFHTDLPLHWVASETVGQFVGLRDKNNVPIFEGDVCNYGNDIREIRFESGGFVSCGFREDGSRIVTSPFGFNYLEGGHEVIGNIHEHPHLLNRKD